MSNRYPLMPVAGRGHLLRVRLEIASLKHAQAFVTAAIASRTLHDPWVSLPATAAKFRQYVQGKSNDRNLLYFVFSAADELVGAVAVNEIVRGGFQSAYLGYYAFAPFQRRGFMTAGLSMVVTRAFRKHGLHRLEANMQSQNMESIGLVRGLGFRREGVSLRYLKIKGRWRDHERWAITREEWKGVGKRQALRALL